MKIGEPGSGQIQGAAISSRPASNGGRHPLGTMGGAAPPDRIQLSNLSAYLADTSSPAHRAKLAGLSAAVSGGTYQVDAVSVSASVIHYSLGIQGAF